MTSFSDHFSDCAGAYAVFRPKYPPDLLRFLAERAPRRELAWDCGTGNGQAAVLLAEHLARVQATDASREQLSHAVEHPRCRVREGVDPLLDLETELAARWPDSGEARAVRWPIALRLGRVR